MLSELELLGREFISLRDTPPAQEWVSKGGFTLVSEGLTLEPPIPPAPHFQPGAKLTLEEASGLGEELTLEEASGLGIEAPKMPREKVQEEDWQRRYEETNTLLEKTQALLVKTKDDFTKRLESLERTLADEQKAVRIAQDEKEAAANTVKEDLGKKQWRIQELEGKVRTLTEAKLELEQKLAGLNMRITEAETAAKQAKSEQGKLQIELEEQRTPTKAREALENEVEAYSVRVAQVEAGYAEMQAHWTEMAQALKLRQGAEQAAQSVQSGAASCSTPLRRFLEKFVAEVRPNAPPAVTCCINRRTSTREWRQGADSGKQAEQKIRQFPREVMAQRESRKAARLPSRRCRFKRRERRMARPVNVKPSAPVNTSEEEDTSKKSSDFKALIGSIAAKFTSVSHKRDGKIRENKMLDAEEYNRRIAFIKAKRNRVNDFGADFLFKTCPHSC